MSCSRPSENDHLLPSDEIGNNQQSDFEISSTNQMNNNVGPSLDPIFMIQNSTKEKIATTLNRLSILLMNGEKLSTSVREDLKKDIKELVNILIELPIRSDEQDQSSNGNPTIEFSFKITMKQKNQLIDQLIKNNGYASFNVSNEMKKDLVSINCKLIIFLFHQSLRPVDGNEIYDFNVNDSSPGHQEKSETQSEIPKFYFDVTKDTPPEHEDLWKAIREQDLKAVYYLIRIKQIDPNLKFKNDWTLLHWASSYGNLEIVKYLLSKGADINARDKNSYLPLHDACNFGNLETVKCFISKLKMDPNSKGWNNDTCLHRAVGSDNLELVKFLIENGGRKSLHEKNILKMTPLEYAKHWNCKEEIIEYLESKCNLHFYEPDSNSI